MAYSIVVIKNEGKPGAKTYWCEAVLRFDLAEIEESRVSAVLKLFNIGRVSSFIAESINHVAYFTEDDNWDEITVTYNTRSQKSNIILGESWTHKNKEEIPGKPFSGWYKCELLLSIVSKKINGDKKLYLYLLAKTKEARGNYPGTFAACSSKDHSNINLRSRLEIIMRFPSKLESPD